MLVLRVIFSHALLICFLCAGIAQSQAQTAPKLVLPIGHTDVINSAAFSPDGKTIVTASRDKTARIWDVKTGKLLRTLEGHMNEVNAAIYSPDGELIVTTSSDSNAIIWDAATGKLLRKLTRHSSEVNIAAFSPDGKKIFTASNYAFEAFLWDVASGQLLYKFKVSQMDWFNSAKFSPDGTTVVTANSDNKVRLWDALTGKLVRNLDGHIDNINGAIFSPDGKLVLTASEDSTACLWDVATGKLLSKLSGHCDNVKTASFSPDGEKVVTVSGDKTARVWDATNGKLLYILFGHLNWIESACFSPDCKTIMTSSGFGSLEIWNSSTGKLINTLFCATDWILNAIFSPDGKAILTLNGERGNYSATIWDPKTNRMLRNFTGKIELVNNVIISPLNETAASSVPFNVKKGLFKSVFRRNDSIIYVREFPELKLLDGLIWERSFIRVWDFNTCKLLYKIVDPSSCLGLLNYDKNFFYSPDGKLITSGLDTTLIWDLKTGQVAYKFYGGSKLKENNYPQNNVLSPDGEKIVTVNKTGKIFIWDTHSGNLIKRIKTVKADLNSIIFSPNSKNILIQCKDLQIWNAISGKFLIKLVDAEDMTGREKILFSPDGTQILATESFGPSRIWDAKTGKLLYTVTSANVPRWKSEAQDVAFCPDSKTFAQVSWSGDVQILDTKNGLFLNGLICELRHVNSVKFSGDGKKILILSNGPAQIWDAVNLVLIHTLQDLNNSLVSANFTTDDKRILTLSSDHKTILWDAASGKPIYHRIELENDNWLVKLPYSPYYMCSKDAGKMLHYVTSDLKVIGFEQLDPVYNRPDVVLDSIGMFLGDADTDLIAQYRRLWEKRVNRLGLDKNKLGKGELAVPSAEIANEELLPYETTADSVSLKITAIDSAYALRRFNVYVNEVPYFGSFGIPLNLSKSRKWDTAVSIPLSLGENKIQVAVLNELGLENYKYPKYINLLKSPEQELAETTHFIGIGVDSFIDQSQNLRYCARDIHDLESLLKSKQYKSKLFINEDVTKENILKIKQYLLDSTAVHDKVIISCSSHGLRDLSDNENLYLATYNTDFEHPKDKGLKYEDLLDLLDGIPARKKLLLIDACNSGDLEDVEAIDSNAYKLQKVNSTALAVNNYNGRGESFDLGVNQSANTIKLSEVFINVQNHNGTVVIGAAGGRQAAQDGVSGTIKGKEIKNGAFTYSVLEYMSQPGEKRVNGLKNYVEKRVPEITNGQQQPTTKQETLETNWLIK